LPGELRNRIYYELLLLTSSEQLGVKYRYNTTTRRAKGCYPQLVATCSTIRNEASSILYGANDINIDITRLITTGHPHNGAEIHSVKILRLPMNLKWTDGPFGSLRTLYQDWPCSLLKFERLHIRCNSETSPYFYQQCRHHSLTTHLCIR
jgi:hypothetical protein